MCGKFDVPPREHFFLYERDSTTITDYVAAKGPSLKKPSVVQGGGVMSMEERQTGGVKARVYGKYALLCGGLFMFSLSMAISIFAAALQVLANWWLTFWLQTETDRPSKTVQDLCPQKWKMKIC